MYSLLNFIIWIRKIIIRIITRQYPNRKLLSKQNDNFQIKKVNLISSTENFWVSKYMFNKWHLYGQNKQINLNIYSNKCVNNFMRDNFKGQLIYELYQKSAIPVQKLDIFRICFIYLWGGIWLDLKSEINLDKALQLYEKSNHRGFLLSEPRKIEVIKNENGKVQKKFENVIHNGFFFLPKSSIFLLEIIKKIERDFLYFQDIIFTHPKQGMMNLTGPHQFTRNFHEIKEEARPLLVNHQEVDWIYCSKYGEFISPFITKKHYSQYKNLKTIDSKKLIDLK
tara:strand:- start:766 stop:1608 length:843 start_codon:yes stop_codon:yes gene_type:complete